MRFSAVCTAFALLAAAASASAQSTVALTPRTTLPAHVMCTDWLVPALPMPVVRIAGAHHFDQRQALSRGDLVVLSRAPGDGLVVGERYLVRRLPVGSNTFLPKSGGYVPIRTPGWVTIAALDEINAVAHVDHACDAIEPGDYLEPYVEPVLPTPDAKVAAPDFSERVQILPGLEGRTIFANGDIFSIARGTEHGVARGARFAIYRDRHDGGPLVHIAEAIVTDLSATSSKLLLLRTTDAVATSDIAVPRR